MSWTSALFACLVPVAATSDGADARRLIETTTSPEHHVLGFSRNGALVHNLKTICADDPRWVGLYLLDDEAVLAGETLRSQHDLLCRLIEAIDAAPGFVVEATSEPHRVHGELHTPGFEPLPFEWVYPPDAVIRDGRVYFHTEASVRALLAAAPCGVDPCPPGDDDGESLQFVFGLLKSHRALLRRALDEGAAVAFAEMSQ